VLGRERVEIKTPGQILKMRAAGLLTSAALESVRAALRPGITPKELDSIGAEVIRAGGGTSNFLGYHGYPATSGVSPGIPCTTTSLTEMQSVAG
jgi:methionyl aminopeptidase